MAKVFLTCFAHVKPLSSDELAIGLFSPLAIDLQHLQKSLEEKHPSLQWCSEAMFVIKKIHYHFLLYLERSKVPGSWEGVNVLDEYMRATLDLLDFCNLLKSTISGLDRHRMMVDFTVKRLEDTPFSTVISKIELERLERENCNKLLDVKKWKEMTFNKVGVSGVKLKANSSMHVLEAVGRTMTIISQLIFCSILHPIPIKIDKGFYTGLPDLDLLSDCIQKLVASFTQRFQDAQHTGRQVLYENEMIEDVFTAFKAQIASAEEGDHKGALPETVNMLKKISLALKQELDLFDCVVNESFEEVIKGRKQVIGLINANNHDY